MKKIASSFIAFTLLIILVIIEDFNPYLNAFIVLGGALVCILSVIYFLNKISKKESTRLEKIIKNLF